MDKYIKIDLDKIGNNVNKLVSHYNNYKYYFGVVKGFGYSHGEYIVNKIIENGINYIVTSSVEEAVCVRKYNKSIPLLCLEPIYSDKIEIALKNNVTFSITNNESLKALLETNKKVKVHIKLDTGMNRFGFKTKEEFNTIYKTIKKSSLELEGIYSHFATTGVNDKIFEKQKKKFLDLVSDIDLKEIPIVHFGRSNTLIKHEKIDFCNGIRIGISMFGFNHTFKVSKIKSVIKNFIKKLKGINYYNKDCPFELEESFSLCSKIIEIKKVYKNEIVGYGGNYKVNADSIIGVIPIGYKDGFNRKNSGRNVLINDKKYKIIGDICMNLSFVLIDETVKIGNEVTLIGKGINVRYVANYLNTTSYEVLCMLENDIPRIYYEKEKEVYIEKN